MIQESIDAALTKPLRNFLEAEGYSHIFSIGIYPNELKEGNENKLGKENFWLEPVKPDDPRLSYIEAGHILNKINDREIIEMLTVDCGFEAMIQIPEETYHRYLGTKRRSRRNNKHRIATNQNVG